MWHPRSHRFAIFAAIALLHSLALVGLNVPVSTPHPVSPGYTIDASIIESRAHDSPLVLPQLSVDLKPIRLDGESALPQLPPLATADRIIEAPVDLTPIGSASATKFTQLTAPPKLDPRFPLPSTDRFFPPNAARTHPLGTVRVAVLVRADGSAASARVERSSGSEQLDEAALEYARTVHWMPGQSGGRATSLWLPMEIVFGPRRSFVRFPSTASPT